MSTSEPAKKANLCARRMSFSFLSSKYTTVLPSPYILLILSTRVCINRSGVRMSDESHHTQNMQIIRGFCLMIKKTG